MAALSSAFVYFSYTFLEPIMAPRLVSFNMTPLQIGLFFSIYPIFYIPSSILVQYIPGKIEKRVTMILAGLITATGFLFVGPS